MITVKDIESVGIYPIYVFGEDYCDKLYIKNEIAMRVRYNTNKTTCTCMSFMKGFYCKHLRMNNGDYGWLRCDYASNVVVVIDKILEHLDFLDIKSFDSSTIPSIVFCVRFTGQLEETVERIVIIYKNKFGVNFERPPIG